MDNMNKIRKKKKKKTRKNEEMRTTNKTHAHTQTPHAVTISKEKKMTTCMQFYIFLFPSLSF